MHASGLTKTDADGGIGTGKRSATHKINRRRGDAGDREKQRPANRRQPNDPPAPREQAHERHRRNHQPKKYGSLAQMSRKTTPTPASSTHPAMAGPAGAWLRSACPWPAQTRTL